jgi:hypothetical protein
MVQIEGSVDSAIEDEDDDEGRGRFGTGGALRQVSAWCYGAPKEQAGVISGRNSNRPSGEKNALMTGCTNSSVFETFLDVENIVLLGSRQLRAASSAHLERKSLSARRL